MKYTEQIELSKATAFEPFVELGARHFANDFQRGHKVFETSETDPETKETTPKNQQAQAYLNKMLRFCGDVSNLQRRKNGGMLNDLQSNFILNLSDAGVQASDLDPETIEEFITDPETGKIKEGLTAVMKSVFELQAEVTQKEKTEYDSLA